MSTSPLRRATTWVLVLLVSCGGPQRQPDRADSPEIHALLVGIEIAEPAYAKYERDDWMRGWDDADGDCQNTRMEVLIRDAVRATLNREGCKVVDGHWDDPYTGKTYTRPSDIDIDHMVPLHEAHRSGGHRWSGEQKKAFANYLGNTYHLIAVEDNANQAKSDKSPERWMPANLTYHCVYVQNWSRIKHEWSLTMTPDEFAFLNAKLKECN